MNCGKVIADRRRWNLYCRQPLGHDGPCDKPEIRSGRPGQGRAVEVPYYDSVDMRRPELKDQET